MRRRSSYLDGNPRDRFLSDRETLPPPAHGCRIGKNVNNYLFLDEKGLGEGEIIVYQS
jgi:hypothetical protein